MLVKTATDPEVKKWRAANREAVFAQLQKLSDKAYRRSKSEKSRSNILDHALIFCSWRKELPEEILRDAREGKVDVYSMLDDYVDWLTKAGVSPITVKNYLSGACRFLRVYGVEVNRDLLKDKVDLPRTYAITQDRAPAPEELKRMLLHTNIRGKAVIATLASSGMRAGELLSLRVKDIDFSKRPVVVALRAEVTKDRQARICFISDEAAGFLKEYLGERIKNQDAYVFQGRHQGVDDQGRVKFVRGQWEDKPMSYWNLDVIVASALRAAGLLQRDEHGRDVIHIHTFRKFFFTRMLGVLGREITEALMGHRQFLDSAYRRYTKEELAQYYVKGMPSVTALMPQTVEVLDPNRLEAIKKEISEKYELEVESLKKVLGVVLEKMQAGEVSGDEARTILSGLSADERAGTREQETAGRGKDAGSEARRPPVQKVVDVGDVEGQLASGEWRFVSPLNQEKVVLERFGPQRGS